VRPTHSPDDGSGKYLAEVGKFLKDNMVQQSRRQPSSCDFWAVERSVLATAKMLLPMLTNFVYSYN
jgi:hypothetical protein